MENVVSGTMLEVCGKRSKKDRKGEAQQLLWEAIFDRKHDKQSIQQNH